MKVLILALWMISANPVLASIGYGSSDAVYSAKNQEFFYMGFTLGLDKGLSPKIHNKVLNDLKVEQIADQKHLSAIRAADKLSKQGVAALVGFPTSHEALLVAKYAKEKKTILISAAAAHSDMATEGPLVYTLGESVTESKRALIDFVSSSISNKKGLLITSDYYVFSVNQANTLKSVNDSLPKKLDIEEVHLAQDQKIPDAIVARLKKREFGYIMLTTYADDSTQILDQIIKHELRVPIIANSSWTIGNIELVRRLLLKVKAPVYCVASVVKGLKSAEKFEKEYKEKYGKAPETEMYYGYDLGQIVAQTLNRISGEITPSSFQKAFESNRCFKGTTTGRVCFPENGGHALRTIYWLKFSKETGFVPLQPTKGSGA